MDCIPSIGRVTPSLRCETAGIRHRRGVDPAVRNCSRSRSPSLPPIPCVSTDKHSAQTISGCTSAGQRLAPQANESDNMNQRCLIGHSAGKGQCCCSKSTRAQGSWKFYGHHQYPIPPILSDPSPSDCEARTFPCRLPNMTPRSPNKHRDERWSLNSSSTPEATGQSV
jgi:hypothetical protein